MPKKSATNKKINVVDKNGWTALHHAANQGDASKVERLLAAGADCEARTVCLCQKAFRHSRPLHVACLNGHVEVVEQLLAHGCDIEATDVDGFVCLARRRRLFLLMRDAAS